MNRMVRILVYNLFRLPGIWSRLNRYAKNPEKYPEPEMWAHIHKTMKHALKGSNVNLQVTGTEHLEGMQGFMIYANHQGLFDVVGLASTCANPLAIVYKKELAEVPFLKQILTCTKSFAMDREDVRQSLTVIQAVTREVQAGRNYVIFPEGTRSKKSNAMNEFHPGSFRCAVKAKCPIIPVAFIDSYKALDQKGSKPLTVQMHYLEPISYEEYKDLKTPELAELVKSRIAQKIEESTK